MKYTRIEKTLETDSYLYDHVMVPLNLAGILMLDEMDIGEKNQLAPYVFLQTLIWGGSWTKVWKIEL